MCTCEEVGLLVRLVVGVDERRLAVGNLIVVRVVVLLDLAVGHGGGVGGGLAAGGNVSTLKDPTGSM